MNRWYQIRRLRGAAFLILIGVLALLNQWRVLTWDKSWPFFLILAGLLALAERAAWTADVRAQQEAREFAAATGPGTETIPPGPGSSSYWSAASPGVVEERPFVQPNPPDEPGREDR